MNDATPPLAASGSPAQAADSRCPRCGGGFHCGAHDAMPCACAGLKLSTALQLSLRKRYVGCLCLACLHSLAEAEGAVVD